MSLALPLFEIGGIGGYGAKQSLPPTGFVAVVLLRKILVVVTVYLFFHSRSSNLEHADILRIWIYL
jgi:hypothetical protein